MRHISMDGDKPSTLLRMLAPVVVNPEMVSNSASIREGISPLIQKGRAPKKLKTNPDTQGKPRPQIPSLA